MFTVAKRLAAAIMALALMIPVVAFSEDVEPVKIIMEKTTFNYDEAIVFTWYADPAQVELSDPLMNGLTFNFEFDDKLIEYSNGYREKTVSFGQDTYKLDVPANTTSGTVSIDIPDCASGTGYLSVAYDEKNTGETKYVRIEGLVINNPVRDTDLIKLTYSKALDDVVAGDEVVIKNEVKNPLENGWNSSVGEQIYISAAGNNPPPYFSDMGKGTYNYIFAKKCKYYIQSGISYSPPSSIPAAERKKLIGYSINVTDIIDVSEGNTTTPVPTSKPTTQPTAAPTVKPTIKPGTPSEPVELNLDAITIGVKQAVSTVKVESGKNITWTSANEKIATVDANGKITGVKKGKTTITATDEYGQSDSVEVTVVAKNKGVKKIKLNKKNATLKQGEKLTLAATLTPSNAKNKNIIWKSSDTSVVTVDSKGKVKAVGTGKATITAIASSGKTAKCEITVTGAKVKKITISGEKTMKKGETQQLTAKIKPVFAENQNLKWKSSNKKIATVDANGVVTALKKGTVTITATAKDGSKVKATFTIKIKK